ncbi:MAG: hypothetical protein HY903_01875 [Deltaproteobacteria bacterium]|nr:hypothetical protein [Deltaproteobacteria bacterium]
MRRMGMGCWRRWCALAAAIVVASCGDFTTGELGTTGEQLPDPGPEAGASTPEACKPDCAGRECGLDPICHQSCGGCDAPDLACAPAGVCLPCFEGEACDDGDPCTFADRCDGLGVCGGTAVTCADSPEVCGPRRSCNGTAICSELFPVAVTACDDGDLCTYSDGCNGAGVCVGTAVVCGDDPGACGASRSCNGTATCDAAYPDANTPCNDGNPSTTSDRCNGAGLCVGAAGGPRCGNGYKEGTELCDGQDFGGATCASLGFASGALGCTTSCMRIFNGCLAVDRADLVDALDPSTVSWDEPAGNVGAWPKTSKIVQGQITASQVIVVRDPMDNWPPVQESGWDKPSIGNWWVIAKPSDGRWHAATIDWLGVGRTAMARPGFDGHDDIHGALGGWRPVSGETVYLVQTTHARSGVIRGNTQRTNIVRTVMP